MKAIAAVTALTRALALAGAPAGHADSNDDAYLKAVAAQGIAFKGGPQEVIELGHLICKELQEGYATNGLTQHFEVNNPSQLVVIATDHSPQEPLSGLKNC